MRKAGYILAGGKQRIAFGMQSGRRIQHCGLISAGDNLCGENPEHAEQEGNGKQDPLRFDKGQGAEERKSGKLFPNGGFFPAEHKENQQKNTGGENIQQNVIPNEKRFLTVTGRDIACRKPAEKQQPDIDESE